MTDAERRRFDRLLEEAIGALPPGIAALVEEVPVIVDDRPDAKLARSLAGESGIDASDAGAVAEFVETLCGLHTGVALTERSVEDGANLPTDVRLFREGIVEVAGGWEAPGESRDDADDAVYEEIMITLLHEIGHHFGLEEEDLERLGYD